MSMDLFIYFVFLVIMIPAVLMIMDICIDYIRKIEKVLETGKLKFSEKALYYSLEIIAYLTFVMSFLGMCISLMHYPPIEYILNNYLHLGI